MHAADSVSSDGDPSVRAAILRRISSVFTGKGSLFLEFELVLLCFDT